MSGRITRSAYEQLIAENIAWLKTVPRTLERDHILVVLGNAVEDEYGPPDRSDSPPPVSPETVESIDLGLIQRRAARDWSGLPAATVIADALTMLVEVTCLRAELARAPETTGYDWPARAAELGAEVNRLRAEMAALEEHAMCVAACEVDVRQDAQELETSLRAELDETRTANDRLTAAFTQRCMDRNAANARAEKAEAALREAHSRILTLAERYWDESRQYEAAGNNIAKLSACWIARAVEECASIVAEEGGVTARPVCKAVCADKVCGEPLIMMCPACSAIPGDTR